MQKGLPFFYLPLKHRLVDHETQRLFVHNDIALLFHALNSARLPFKFNLLLQICLVAVYAKPMHAS